MAPTSDTDQPNTADGTPGSRSTDAAAGTAFGPWRRIFTLRQCSTPNEPADNGIIRISAAGAARAETWQTYRNDCF
jgi:hypothetical protein